ncbi:MAG: aminotransferase class III-fold pyridoxal phosphate-dependent enzyme [Actinomycetota bacterium]
MEREQVWSLYGSHVNAGKIAAYDQLGLNVVMGQRSGIRFSDAYSDRSWINCHCNGGLFNLGHRNPQVIAAVEESLLTVDIGNHHLPTPGRAELGQRLAATTGNHLPGVVFGVSGGEAIDLAIKVTRAATGRTDVVSVEGGYHGHTGLALAAGDPQYRDPFGPNPPGWSQVPFNSIDAMRQAVTRETAAVILETVPATLGMPIPDSDYLPAIQQICEQHGAKLILDEVQTGLGRTGRIWGYQHFDVQPDVVVTAKALSGGIYPITATLMTRDLHSIFDDDPFLHISTLGGAEPGCAAALSVLDQIETPGFLERVTELEVRFVAGLSGMPFELRHLGLMMALKFPAPGAAVMAMQLLYNEGLFALYANNDTSALQFLPPLIVTDEEADEIINIVRRTFA